MVKAQEKSIVITSKTLENYTGAALPYGLAGEIQVGQVTGLAWTEVGGELLTIEAALVPGRVSLPTPDNSAGGNDAGILSKQR